MILYLSHPLTTRVPVRLWQEAFEKRTKIKLLNPFYDEGGEDLQRLKDPSKEYCREIVYRDLNMIKRCDGLLAIMEAWQESSGTPMEIFYNSQVLFRPTYVITKDFKDHPWIKGLTEVFETKEAFERYIIGRTK